MKDFEQLRRDLEKTCAKALTRLDNLRAELHTIDDRISWLKSAPLPLEDVLHKIDNFIDTKLTDTSGLIRPFFYQHELGGLQPLEAPVKLDSASIMLDHGSLVGSGIADVSVLIPVLGASAVKESLYAMATRESENMENGPMLADRQAMILELENRKYALEVEEEELICIAEENEIDGFYRRQDCSPEIVLLINDESE